MEATLKQQNENRAEALLILNNYDFFWRMSDRYGASDDAEWQMKRFVRLAANSGDEANLRAAWIERYNKAKESMSRMF